MSRRVLHLLRRADAPHPPAGMLKPGDSLMSLDDVSADKIIREIFDHHVCIVWGERRS
jgi:hypothetical protein